MDSQKHIYEYVSSSGSYRAYTIRLSVAEYSSSGSYRACIIRLSVAGYSSYRCSSALFFSLPIRRDLSPNNHKLPDVYNYQKDASYL